MKRKFLLLTIIAISLLSFPKINFGQAINLGAAADFVLFTKNGALNDNAVAHSHLTGDVGYEIAGSIGGFGNVNGVMRSGVDAKTTAAGISLPNAITAINARIVDFFPASGTLGNGDTLIAGVYEIVGDATQNLNLYLDAKGDPSAEFIIKISGKFEPAALSKVILLNGAQACHVFWKVDGVVSMATGVVMKGSILGSAAINMATLDTLEGRLLTTVGAITIDGILAYTPLCAGEPLLTGPVAPDLASIACYTIFSSTGALTNTIPTNISGDVGKDNDGAAISGWNQSYISPGTLHSVRDASTVQAAADLSNAYNSLNAMTEDIELLYPNDLGYGLVLTPHTYLVNSGAAASVSHGPGPAKLTDTISFDAQGNPDAVFVIKVTGGAFTAFTGSNVKLINGAQSKNIYWMVQGAMNINNNCIFRGTIVIPVGAVNMVNTNILLDGRALTMSGLITTTGLTAFSSCCPSFTVTASASATTICKGTSVTLTGSGATTYAWSDGVVNGVSFTPLATKTYTVTGTASVGCTKTFTITVVVNDLPIVTGNASPSTVCAGATSTLTGSGANTYAWTDGVIDGAVFIPASTHTYTVTGTDLNNCTNTATKSITVKLLPIVTGSASAATICAGDSDILTGSGANTYAWTDGVVDGLGFIPVSTHTYTVTGTALNGCTNTATTPINVTNLPVVTASASATTICAGDSDTLRGAGAVSYSWTGGVTDGAGFVPPSTDTYTVTGTTNGCSDTAIVTINVNLLPIAVANSNSPVCIDDTLNLTAQTVVGASYNWTGPNGYGSTAQDSLIIDAAVSNSGTYSLTVTKNGCTSTVSTVTVSVNDCSTDLSIIKTVDKMTPFMGRTVVFTLVADNNGPLNATGVEVSDPLQNGYTYVSSNATSGSYDPATGVWTIGTFNNGASATLSITATVLTEGNYVNTAIIYGNEVDLNMVNNVSTVEPIPTDFFIPEGFSPNGDGINDVFVIRGILNYPENTFTIYNRWGNKVFETGSYKNTWDGTTTTGLNVGGNELPVGTYFYILDLGDGSDIFKGTIYLNR